MAWTIERKTKAGVGITLIVLLMNAALSYRATRTLIEHEQRVSHTHEVLTELEAVLLTLKDAETGERGYIITGDESYLEPYRSAVDHMNGRIEKLKELTADNPGQQARIPALQHKIDEGLRNFARGIALKKSAQTESAMQLVASGVGKRLMDDLRRFIDGMETEENELLKKRVEEADTSARIAILTFPIDTTVACALLIVISFVVVRDITARKRAAEAVRQQRQWLQVTLSSIGDGVVAADTNGRVTFLNPVAQSITRWKQEEAEGQPLEQVFRIVHEETRAAVENPALQAMREGSTVSLANHTVLITKDGSEIPIDDSGSPIITPDGQTLGAVLIFRDITARKSAEAERAQLLVSERAAREQAEAASRAKDDFVAIISHELRTPLNAILGWAQLLRAGKFDEVGKARAVESIERSARTQSQIIEDLLDVSRVIAGKLALQVRAVELTKVVEAAIESVRPAADAKSIQLLVRLRSKVGFVSGDPNRLQQVVWNLLSNAVKFTPRNGRIEVRVERVNSHVEMTVTDSGTGISPEFLPHVFDRFSQANTTPERKYGGLGLGLAIVRHLVESHGGTVHADSPGEGLGATFTVTLPVRAVRDAAGEPCLSAAGRDSAPSADESILAGLRVLVVDDEPETRDLLTAMLNQHGAEVRSCSSAADALATVLEWRPSVLVSDIGMPNEDGYSLIRKFRALEQERGGYIPAVALTAYARSVDRLRALAAGFQMHLAKPVETTELVMVIASLAGRTGKYRTA